MLSIFNEGGGGDVSISVGASYKSSVAKANRRKAHFPYTKLRFHMIRWETYGFNADKCISVCSRHGRAQV
jgi:hypothetical protein